MSHHFFKSLTQSGILVFEPFKLNLAVLSIFFSPAIRKVYTCCWQVVHPVLFSGSTSRSDSIVNSFVGVPSQEDLPSPGVDVTPMSFFFCSSFNLKNILLSFLSCSPLHIVLMASSPWLSPFSLPFFLWDWLPSFLSCHTIFAFCRLVLQNRNEFYTILLGLLWVPGHHFLWLIRRKETISEGQISDLWFGLERHSLYCLLGIHSIFNTFWFWLGQKYHEKSFFWCISLLLSVQAENQKCSMYENEKWRWEKEN